MITVSCECVAEETSYIAALATAAFIFVSWRMTYGHSMPQQPRVYLLCPYTSELCVTSLRYSTCQFGRELLDGAIGIIDIETRIDGTRRRVQRVKVLKRNKKGSAAVT